MNSARALGTVAVVVCFIFVFSAVLLPFAQADWTMFRGDPSHIGVGTGNSVLSPKLLWNYTANGSVESSPSVVNGVVYISAGHNVYALGSPLASSSSTLL